jgi:prophage tail gpP-like protein
MANYAATFYTFPQVTVQEGDSVFNLISKLCKLRGVLALGGIFEDHKETLMITTVGDSKASDALITGTPKKAYWREVGHNIKSWNIEEDNSNRFSKYIVKGQAHNFDPVNSPEGISSGAATAPSGVATDSAITRYRPKVIIAENPGNAGDMERRAKWESMVRAGGSRKVTYTIQGLSQRNGDPWDINSLVAIHDEFNGIYADLLIETVNMRKDLQQGTTTTFNLVHPLTYTVPDVSSDASKIKGTFDPNTPEPFKEK